jgi:hypothetical protein
MSAGPWVIYNEFLDAQRVGAVDLDNDVFKIGLFTSDSNCGDAALVNALYGTLTNEVVTGGGYGQGGNVLTISAQRIAAILSVAGSDATWVTVDTGITARFAVIWDHTLTDKNLVAYCLLNGVPEPTDVTVDGDNELKVFVGTIYTQEVVNA